MELREAIGNRRSIRFLLPHRPVELDKIQCMLEAARLASHWGNMNSLRAVVIQRDKASQDVIDALPSPVGGYQIQLAPVVIVWYIETEATDHAGERLSELVK
ncbi:MAG: nitroreductase family protein, partial [Desulfobacterales bacterium]|nr:nitroreductase family protein [Desulfobacterales bacterium]